MHRAKFLSFGIYIIITASFLVACGQKKEPNFGVWGLWRGAIVPSSDPKAVPASVPQKTTQPQRALKISSSKIVATSSINPPAKQVPIFGSNLNAFKIASSPSAPRHDVDAGTPVYSSVNHGDLPPSVADLASAPLLIPAPTIPTLATARDSNSFPSSISHSSFGNHSGSLSSPPTQTSITSSNGSVDGGGVSARVPSPLNATLPAPAEKTSPGSPSNTSLAAATANESDQAPASDAAPRQGNPSSPGFGSFAIVSDADTPGPAKPLTPNPAGANPPSPPAPEPLSAEESPAGLELSAGHPNARKTGLTALALTGGSFEDQVDEVASLNPPGFQASNEGQGLGYIFSLVNIAAPDGKRSAATWHTLAYGGTDCSVPDTSEDFQLFPNQLPKLVIYRSVSAEGPWQKYNDESVNRCGQAKIFVPMEDEAGNCSGFLKFSASYSSVDPTGSVQRYAGEKIMGCRNFGINEGEYFPSTKHFLFNVDLQPSSLGLDRMQLQAISDASPLLGTIRQGIRALLPTDSENSPPDENP